MTGLGFYSILDKIALAFLDGLLISNDGILCNGEKDNPFQLILANLWKLYSPRSSTSVILLDPTLGIGESSHRKASLKIDVPKKKTVIKKYL